MAVCSSYLEEDAMFEASGVGTPKKRMVPQQALVDILQPRAQELFSLIKQEVSRAGYESVINAGLVITGGGSMLTGVTEIAELEFNLPARLGKPTGIGGLVDVVSSPSYSTAIGLIKFGLSKEAATRNPEVGVKKFYKRLKDFFLVDF